MQLLYPETAYYELIPLQISINQAQDRKIASLVNYLNPNSLKEFELREAKAIGCETLLSLRRHGESLSSLSLTLNKEILILLHLLGPCPNLDILEASGKSDESNDIPPMPSARAWLKGCKRLQSLRILDSSLGPPLTIDLLLGDVPLRKLHLCPHKTGYEKTFYQALGAKTSLRELTLRFTGNALNGEHHPDPPDERFVAAILNLESLESLNITCRSLKEDFIISAANRLVYLRSFDILCGLLSDNIWPSMRKLRSLKSFTSYSENVFSANKILSYISKLGPSNEGLCLRLSYPQTGFSDKQISRLQTMLKAKVGGTLDFW